MDTSTKKRDKKSQSKLLLGAVKKPVSADSNQSKPVLAQKRTAGEASVESGDSKKPKASEETAPKPALGALAGLGDYSSSDEDENDT